MRNTKNRFTMAGLCLISALAATALFATSAQAKGDWFVELEKKPVLLTKTIEFESEEDVMQTISIPALNAEILCEKLPTVDDGLLFSGGGMLATFLFRGCFVYQISPKLEQLPACKAEDFEAKVKGLLVLHEKKTYLLVEPDNEKAQFGVIKITGGECPLPQELKLTGSIVYQECAPNSLETTQEKHLLEPASSKLFPSDVLKVGANTATLSGSVWWKLKGEHAFLAWKGIGL
jgi:hypothetical protein